MKTIELKGAQQRLVIEHMVNAIITVDFNQQVISIYADEISLPDNPETIIQAKQLFLKPLIN